MNKRRQNISIMWAIVATALTVRLPITLIGPLASLIQEDLGLSSASTGLLTTVPVMLYAFMTLVCHTISARINDKMLSLYCVIIIFLGSVVRSMSTTWGVFIGTVMLGVAIGILNVRIPVIIKNQFHCRLAFYMGVYSSALTASSGIALGFSPALVTLTGTWQTATLVMAMGAIPAIALWAVIPESKLLLQSSQETFEEVSEERFDWSQRKKYLPLGMSMGAQALLFYSFTAWLPSILLAYGRSLGEVSFLMLFLQLITLPSNLACGVTLQKIEKKWHVALIGSVLFFIGLLLILISRGVHTLQFFGVSMIGIGNGFMFAMPLVLIGLSGKTERDTSNISAYGQLLCNTVGATGPFLMGWIYDLTKSWKSPLSVMLLGTVMMFIFSKMAADRVQEDQLKHRSSPIH